MHRPHRHLDGKGCQQGHKNKHLLRIVQLQLMPGQDVEVAIGRMPQINEGNQRQQGPHQRVQEELERRIDAVGSARPEEHTSELQSLMRISYAVFCLNHKKKRTRITTITCTDNNNYTIDIK